MFFKPKEHEPSHIHALYGEHIGIFDLKTMQMTEGDLPKKAQELVKEWMSANQKELLNMWDSQKLGKLPPLKGGIRMLPRIQRVTPLPDYILRVLFDDGKTVLYDVKEDMNEIESYRELKDIYGLFNQVQLDQSRTCVFWNERIDLPSDTLYEYGATQ